MWSGPRNLSTAMMRSFGARPDTVVSDEPFYGAYLDATGDDQPMRAAVIASMDCDWHSVARAMSGPPPEPRPIWYQKHMAHHMEGPVGIADLPGHTHAFLIRDPARVVASYAAKRVRVRPEHLGVARQREYFDREADRLGHAPPVIDSADILRDPPGTLAALCAALGVPWNPAMRIHSATTIGRDFVSRAREAQAACMVAIVCPVGIQFQGSSSSMRVCG